MTDGQGSDRRVHGRGNSTIDARSPPAAGPTVSLSVASWLPARTRAWPTISFVPLASSLASNLSATRAFAMRPECTSPRLPGLSRQPRSREPLRVHLQRIRGSDVRADAAAATSCGTGHSAAMELTSRLLNDNRDEDCDRLAGCDSKPRVPDFRRQDGPAVGRPCWFSPGRRSRPTLTSPARPGSRSRHPQHRVLSRSPDRRRGDGRRSGGVTYHGGAELFAISFPRWRNTNEGVVLCAFFHVRPAADGGAGLVRRRCSRRAPYPNAKDAARRAKRLPTDHAAIDSVINRSS